MDLSSLAPAAPSSSAAPASSSAPAPSEQVPAAPAADPVAHGTDESTDSAVPQASETEQADLSFDLPTDFAVPDGIPLGKIDANAPLAKAAAAYAREHGLTQPQFSSLLKVYADHAVSEAQAYRKSIEQEGQKLGPDAVRRGAAIKGWLVSKIGAEAAEDFARRFFKASDIENFERLAGTFKREVVPAQPGGPPPDLAHRLWAKRLGTK